MATNVNKGITVRTQQNRGTVRHGDFYPSHVEVIKGSGFVNSRESRPVRDADSSERLFREIHQTDTKQGSQKVIHKRIQKAVQQLKC
jgi:hypothetical protein